MFLSWKNLNSLSKMERVIRMFFFSHWHTCRFFFCLLLFFRRVWYRCRVKRAPCKVRLTLTRVAPGRWLSECKAWLPWAGVAGKDYANVQMGRKVRLLNENDDRVTWVLREILVATVYRSDCTLLIFYYHFKSLIHILF